MLVITGILAALPGLPAFAADDVGELEDQIRELEVLLNEQRKEIEYLRGVAAVKKGDKVAGGAVAAAASAGSKANTPPLSASVGDDDDDSFGSGALKIDVSGQISRAYMFGSSDGTKRHMNVDNAHAPTYFRLGGSAPASAEGKFGGLIEIGLPSSSSGSGSGYSVTFEDEDTTNSTAVQLRRIEAYAQHNRFGKLSLGQGDSASYGAGEQDLSGTRTALSAMASYMGGSLQFDGEPDTKEKSGAVTVTRGVTGNTATSATYSPFQYPSVGDIFGTVDGLGIVDRVRYDTPSLAGVSLSTSFAENMTWDVAARYRGEFGGYQLAIGAGFASNTEAAKRTIGSKGLIGTTGTNYIARDDVEHAVDRDYLMAASASLLSPYGLSLTGAVSHGNTKYRRIPFGPLNNSNSLTDNELSALNDRDDMFYYAKLGYTMNIFRFGPTSVALDWGFQNEHRQTGESAQMFGAGIVQRINKWGAEIFLSGRRYMLDLPANDRLGDGGSRTFAIASYLDRDSAIGADDASANAGLQAHTPDPLLVIMSGVRLKF